MKMLITKITVVTVTVTLKQSLELICFTHKKVNKELIETL